MSTYIVGDIHGSYEGLTNLLEAIEFRKRRDRLWCVGDVVNRGPHSAECIKTLMELGSSCRCVMGNHEILLLACAWGLVEEVPPALDLLLSHRDADAMVEWVRRRPFLLYSHLRAVLVVHAGIPPHWSFHNARGQARRLRRIMCSDAAPDFLSKALDLSHNRPDELYGDGFNPFYALHALTMLRHCGPNGETYKDRDEFDGASSEDEFMPWFNYPRPGRVARTTHYVFGHWAGLNGVERPYLHGLDTGCVRGGTLTAYELEADRLHHVSCEDCSMS